MRTERLTPGRRPPARLVGAVLTTDVVVAGARWSKGRRLSSDDLAAWPRELGATAVTVLSLDRGEIHEDEAARRLAAGVAGEGVVARPPVESRVDLRAAHDGVLHVRVAALTRLNAVDPLEVFTAFHGSVVSADQVVASAKISPHIVAAAVVSDVLRRVDASARPIVEVRPFRPMRVAVIVKESVRAGDRERFERSVRDKVTWLGSELTGIAYVTDGEPEVRSALASVASADRGPAHATAVPPADVVLTAGGRSTDPLDPFFVAIDALGGRVVRHGVPAHPGSMLWLARIGRTSILGLPTCGAYSRATAADLVLPRLLTGELATRRLVADLGHGGLLTRDQRFRFPAYARRLEAPEG